MARVDDIDARLAGAQLDWPNDWDKAFDADTIAEFAAWLCSFTP